MAKRKKKSLFVEYTVARVNQSTKNEEDFLKGE